LGTFTFNVAATTGGTTTVNPWTYYQARLTSPSSATSNTMNYTIDGVNQRFNPISNEQFSGINIITVPEPSTYALVSLLGMGALAWSRRRKVAA
jgi:hypothetical protein